MFGGLACENEYAMRCQFVKKYSLVKDQFSVCCRFLRSISCRERVSRGVFERGAVSQTLVCVVKAKHNLSYVSGAAGTTCRVYQRLSVDGFREHQ